MVALCLIFNPFLEADQHLAQVEARLSRLPTLHHTVSELAQQLPELSEQTSQAMAHQLALAFEHLRTDFRLLSDEVARIKRDNHPVEDERDEFEPAIQQLQMPIQMQRRSAPKKPADHFTIGPALA